MALRQRVQAAVALLDRGWGKAAQLVAVDGEIKQLVEVKLSVVTAGESRAIEHSSPTASSENSANQPATPQPIDIIGVDCFIKNPFYAQLVLRRATLSNSSGGFGSFLGPGAGEGPTGGPR